MLDIDSSNLELKKQIVLEKWGEILKLEMINRCPKEYGTMVASIETEKSPDEVAVGTHGIPYASFVEYGTKPHSIDAKEGGYLRFKVKGKYVTVKHVNHPGFEVGTPEEPRTEWDSQQFTGTTAPFARSASFFTEEERMNVLKEAFH